MLSNHPADRVLPYDDFELEQSGAIITARVRAPELTHLRMQELVDECLQRARHHNGRHVILDLREVEFLASACVGPVVSLLQELEHLCGRLALVRCQERVALLFRITRLDSVVAIHDDEEEARKHLHM